MKLSLSLAFLAMIPPIGHAGFTLSRAAQIVIFGFFGIWLIGAIVFVCRETWREVRWRRQNR